MSLHRCYYSRPSITEITHTAVLRQDHWMVRCDPRNGKYNAMELHYRGDTFYKEVVPGIRQLRTIAESRTDPRFRLLDWFPGFRVRTEPKPITIVPGWTDDALGRQPRACTMIANTSAIAPVLLTTEMQARDWIRRKGSSSIKLEFAEAVETLAMTREDYHELDLDEAEEEEEELFTLNYRYDR